MLIRVRFWPIKEDVVSTRFACRESWFRLGTFWCDWGCGVAGFGLASHLGVLVDIPTIGIGKNVS